MTIKKNDKVGRAAVIRLHHENVGKPYDDRDNDQREIRDDKGQHVRLEDDAKRASGSSAPLPISHRDHESVPP